MRRGAGTLVLLGVLAFAIWSGARAGTAPRGIRNNNPGNVRRSSDQWVGLRATQTDPEYFQFTAPVYGIRAMARVLTNYQRRHGLRTLEAMLKRYSPVAPQPAYTNAIAERMDMWPQFQVNLERDLPALIAAIIVQENGINPYSAATIREGIRLAS